MMFKDILDKHGKKECGDHENGVHISPEDAQRVMRFIIDITKEYARLLEENDCLKNEIYNLQRDKDDLIARGA